MLILFFSRTRLLIVLLLKKASFFLFSLLTLFLCLQHFHNNFLLNKESTPDPITNTFSTHGSTAGPADVFFRVRTLTSLERRSQSITSAKLVWAHAACGFWCFPNLPSRKVNNSISRGSGQPSFVSGCITGEPPTVCQTLNHSESLQTPSLNENVDFFF